MKVRLVGVESDVTKTSLVIIASPVLGSPGVGLLTSEQRRTLWAGRLPPGLVAERGREDALAHARVVAMESNAVFIDQHGSPRVIRAQKDRVIVTDEPPPPSGRAFVSLSEAERTPFAEQGLLLARQIAASAIETRRLEILRLLDRAKGRIERRRTAISGDLDKIAQANIASEQAEWLIAEAARAPRGATKLVATSWSTGEPVPIEIPLDPSRGAKDQVLAMFRRAKRLRIGGRIANERLHQTGEQLAAIRAEAEGVRDATSLVEVEECLLRAKRAAPRDVTLVAAAHGPRPKAHAGPRGRVA
jgi:hypothetical protein